MMPVSFITEPLQEISFSTKVRTVHKERSASDTFYLPILHNQVLRKNGCPLFQILTFYIFHYKLI